MGLLQPAPAVIGGISITAIVGLIVLAHFVLCVVILANVDSEKPVTAGSQRLRKKSSRHFQCESNDFQSFCRGFKRFEEL